MPSKYVPVPPAWSKVLMYPEKDRPAWHIVNELIGRGLPMPDELTADWWVEYLNDLIDGGAADAS